jgi:hypothetical protein
MKIATLIGIIVVVVALYFLGHHGWHDPIVTGMNAITRFFTGTK